MRRPNVLPRIICQTRQPNQRPGRLKKLEFGLHPANDQLVQKYRIIIKIYRYRTEFLIHNEWSKLTVVEIFVITNAIKRVYCFLEPFTTFY